MPGDFDLGYEAGYSEGYSCGWTDAKAGAADQRLTEIDCTDCGAQYHGAENSCPHCNGPGR